MRRARALPVSSRINQIGIHNPSVSTAKMMCSTLSTVLVGLPVTTTAISADWLSIRAPCPT